MGPRRTVSGLRCAESSADRMQSAPGDEQDVSGNDDGRRRRDRSIQCRRHVLPTFEGTVREPDVNADLPHLRLSYQAWAKAEFTDSP